MLTSPGFFFKEANLLWLKIKQNSTKPIEKYSFRGSEAHCLNSLSHSPNLRPKEKSLLKTLWEKEKMLVSIIFSFSHNVFYPSQNQFFKSNILSFGKELTCYHTILIFNDSEKEAFSKHCEKIHF